MFSKSLLSAAFAVSAVYAQTSNTTTNSTSLASVLASNSNLTSFSNILALYPSVAQSLSNATNMTIFAPSNAAFALVNSSGVLSQDLATSGFVQALLSYHVHSGVIHASNISTTPKFLHSALSNETYSNVTGGQVVEARLSGTTAEIVSGLKSISNISQANINFTGGVIHIIDTLLTIPPNVSTTASAANLTAFLGAVNASGLTETVNTASNFTIFAPSNSAFQDVASGLSNLTTAELTDIFSYHVLNGTVAYSTTLKNETVHPLSGGNLTFTIENGTAYVNSARIVNADILIPGGVMHIIDAVLNPNNTAAHSNSTATAAVSAFSGATSASTVPYTSGVATPTTTIAVLITTTEQVVQSYTSTVAAAASSSTGKTSKAGAAPTGVIGAAALFGGAAFLANL